jgi:hypothetical protein
MNRRWRRALAITGALAAVGLAWIYGAWADTSTVVTYWSTPSVKMVKYDWAANGVGTASGPTLTVCNGIIETVVFMPSTTYATVPTDNFDVTITTAQGDDILNSLGANITNDALTYKNRKDGLGSVSNSLLTFAVSGAGATGEGVVVVYLR